MPSKDDNLNRGKLPGKAELIPQPHGGALAKPGGPGTGDVERLLEGRRQIEETKERVKADPDAALEEIHADLTSLTKKILKRAERSGKAPERSTMDVIREFRQTQEAVNEARRARGAVAGTESFFAQMDVRLAEAQARMEHGPVPATAVSA